MPQDEELGLRQLRPDDVDLQAQPEAARKILLGYGKWTTRNGREVVYNRRYRPLWERVSSGAPWQRANPREWVREIDGHEWFYNDGHDKRQKVSRAKSAMQALGIPLPSLRLRDAKEAIAKHFGESQ